MAKTPPRETLDTRIRRLFPDTEVPEPVLVLDANYLVNLPVGEYVTFAASARRYHFVLTKAVEAELHKKGGDHKVPLMTDAMKRLLYDSVRPEKIKHYVTPEERKQILEARAIGCRKSDPISEPDIEQIAYAIAVQRTGKPVVMLSHDGHITGTVEALRTKYNYDIQVSS